MLFASQCSWAIVSSLTCTEVKHHDCGRKSAAATLARRILTASDEYQVAWEITGKIEPDLTVRPMQTAVPDMTDRAEPSHGKVIAVTARASSRVTSEGRRCKWRKFEVRPELESLASAVEPCGSGKQPPASPHRPPDHQRGWSFAACSVERQIWQTCALSFGQGAPARMFAHAPFPEFQAKQICLPCAVV